MTPSQERARAYALSTDVVLPIIAKIDMWPKDIQRLIDSVAAALHAHGLAERRAGASEMRDAAFALARDRFKDPGWEGSIRGASHAIASDIRALPLPGDDHE